MGRKLLTTEQLPEWHSFYSLLEDRHVYAHPDYLACHADYYRDDVELYIFQDGETFFYYPYFVRKIGEKTVSEAIQSAAGDSVDIYSAWYYGGVLCNDKSPAEETLQAFWKDFESFAADRKIVSEFVRCDAMLANQELYPPGTVEYERDTVYVNLEQDNDAVWKGFSNDNRRRYLIAEEHGFKIRQANNDDDKDWLEFYEVYTNEMERKSAPRHLRFTWDYFDSLRTRLPSIVNLLVVEKDGQYCGGAIMVHDMPTSYYFLSASKPEFWPENINNFLFTKAIFWSKQGGYPMIDFMGGRPGVFRFKCNFSRDRSRFFVKKAVHDPERYEKITHAAAGSGLDPESGMFPSYLPVLEL